MNLNKRNIIILSALLLILFTLVYQVGKPPITWEDSFDAEKDKPYGALYLKKAMPFIAPNKKLLFSDQSINLSKKDSALPDHRINLILNKYFNPTEIEIAAIQEGLENGEDFFISAYQINEAFLDSLNIEADIDWVDFSQDSLRVSSNEKDGFSLQNRSLKKFQMENQYSIFSKVEEFPNGIIAPYGKGRIYLHLAPNAFINYHILKQESIAYLENVFSRIEQPNIVWNTYYHPNMNKRASSPFYVIFENRSLKAALQISVFGTLLFMLFGLKRKQRVIPIITSLKNQSLSLAKNIAALNLKQKNHRENLLSLQKMTKKEIYHRFRIHFKHNESFYQQVSSISGIEESWCTNQLAYLLGFKPGDQLNKKEYKQLFDIYQEFKNKSER